MATMSRLLEYLLDRCNPVQMGLMTICFGGAIAVLVPATFGLPAFSLGLVLLAFFLFLVRLRLVDDIKDIRHDAMYHRERPTSRGVVGVWELAVLAGVVFAAELSIAWSLGPEAFILFAIGTIYAGALFFEAVTFDFLRRYFALYIFLHEIMLVPALFYLFLVSGVSLVNLVSVPGGMLALFFTLALFQVELIRKVRAPQRESRGADTYTARYGVPAAVAVCIGNAGLVVAAWCYLLFSTLVPGPLALFCGLVPLLVWFGFIHIGHRFVSDPCPQTAGTFFLAGSVFVIVVLAATVFTVVV